MDEREAIAQIVVCDAGPLIHLEEVGCIDLLSDFAQVYAPPVVWEEIARHRPAALKCQGVRLAQMAPRTAPPVQLEAIARLFGLHLGEWQALQIATEQAADLLLTDDTAARLAAKHLAIPVHGTIGMLLRSIRRRQRTARQIAATLRSLPSTSTLHLKRSLLEEIIQTVETMERMEQ